MFQKPAGNRPNRDVTALGRCSSAPESSPGPWASPLALPSSSVDVPDATVDCVPRLVGNGPPAGDVAAAAASGSASRLTSAASRQYRNGRDENMPVNCLASEHAGSIWPRNWSRATSSSTDIRYSSYDIRSSRSLSMAAITVVTKLVLYSSMSACLQYFWLIRRAISCTSSRRMYDDIRNISRYTSKQNLMMSPSDPSCGEGSV